VNCAFGLALFVGAGFGFAVVGAFVVDAGGGVESEVGLADGVAAGVVSSVEPDVLLVVEG
jgi:hypothetical protein